MATGLNLFQERYMTGLGVIPHEYHMCVQSQITSVARENSYPVRLEESDFGGG